ncbi:UDP-N-acetylmuramate: L-alanyl-gamma-D-glutamyl-meso-diaminopimelate ligase [Natronocella acetinitrilica]|uniref:UDP-N-acetylmuramate--L-alanyl-gamma-D-glutamyl-meso-2,6-diaminoheptandioate ligase n=2 Tax=Natronocella acetinitrilica TaxID=414046 RepID=A0AAE3KBX4_9GAMM|nr:UDP-N-acetylmuramate: L-alanyl-gamma-D-glutamyl-meso-diaminopimelate ligase [Natronocella acetinitrilica]
MGSLALLARDLGYRVSGWDRNVYPPMSTLLESQGIAVTSDEDATQLEPAPDCVIIGNALSRGHPLVEAVLDRGLPYASGPQWLAEHVLQGRWVLAVSGTHGKTTTAGILAWLLEDAGLDPGFLIGGVPGNFDRSARLGSTPFFVIEADEYDTAFFDKRSKFVHFRPRTLVINNLEHDHADIFPDLAAIQTQFHHLVRTVPGGGLILANGDQTSIAETLQRGCWTPVTRFGAEPDNDYRLQRHGDGWGVTDTAGGLHPLAWSQPGEHNARNALAALLAARHVGVPLEQGLASLAGFRGMKRRQELRGTVAGVRVFDDFAHHPTAISATLQAMRPGVTAGRLIAVLEPRSNTMKLGSHQAALPSALNEADQVFLFQPPAIDWRVADIVERLSVPGVWSDNLEQLVTDICDNAQPGDCVVVMSNGSFGGIHERLLQALSNKEQTL